MNPLRGAARAAVASVSSLVVLAALAGCAGLDFAPSDPSRDVPAAGDVAADVAAGGDAAPSGQAGTSATAAGADGRASRPPPRRGTPRSTTRAPRRGPLPASGPIELAGRCSQADEDGFRETAAVEVRKGSVKALAWQIWVGRRGTCRFDLADFEQTRSMPHVELTARDRSGCRLMMYSDPRRVTLAHVGCAQRCTNGVADQAWPVMFDPRSGGCAALNR